MELNNFITYVPLSSIPPDPILSPPTFSLNVTSYSHTAAVETAPEDNSPQKSPTQSFCFRPYISNNILRKYFFSFN